MTAVRAAAAVVAAALVLGGCSEVSGDSGRGDRDAASPERTCESSSGSVPTGRPGTPGAESALTLTTSTKASESCISSGVRDFAWFEVEWQAQTDLESLEFELVDPVVVVQVGDVLTVPPVNFGGRIEYSGMTGWVTRSHIAKSGQVSWPQHDQVWASSPLEGETGLVVQHLRFDGTPASIAGVRATWTTADGEAGETSVHVPEQWTFRKNRADCA